jgi:hypothetical protein
MDVYEQAAAEALTRVPDPEAHEGVAAALLNLAYAATSAGEYIDRHTSRGCRSTPPGASECTLCRE